MDSISFWDSLKLPFKRDNLKQYVITAVVYFAFLLISYGLLNILFPEDFLNNIANLSLRDILSVSVPRFLLYIVLVAVIGLVTIGAYNIQILLKTLRKEFQLPRWETEFFENLRDAIIRQLYQLGANILWLIGGGIAIVLVAALFSFISIYISILIVAILFVLLIYAGSTVSLYSVENKRVLDAIKEGYKYAFTAEFFIRYLQVSILILLNAFIVDILGKVISEGVIFDLVYSFIGAYFTIVMTILIADGYRKAKQSSI